MQRRRSQPRFTRRTLSPVQIRRMYLPRFLVTPAEVQNALSSPKEPSSRLIPLSAAWFLPNDPEKRTGYSSFTSRRIPGSRFFDLDKISNTSVPWPHMLPQGDKFAEAMSKLGIRRDDSVVVYDTAELGIFSAPRVAWTLKVFGHERVHLLNNFRIWVNENRPIESGEPRENIQSVEYTMPQPWPVSEHVAEFDEMQSVVSSNMKNELRIDGPTIIDARPTGRWEGTAPEPRPGMPSGHMPRSKSVAFSEVLDTDTKAILPPEQLKSIFAAKDIPLDREIISSCGTGVTAAVVDTALASAGGFRDLHRRIYDGSWTEWASRVRPDDGYIVSAKG